MLKKLKLEGLFTLPQKTKFPLFTTSMVHTTNANDKVCIPLWTVKTFPACLKTFAGTTCSVPRCGVRGNKKKEKRRHLIFEPCGTFGAIFTRTIKPFDK